jgi:hypothetical protein
MFGLGPMELIIILAILGAMGFVGALVLRVLFRAAFPQSPTKCPHCGKDLF